MRRKKKESEKSLKRFVISHILCTFAPTMSHWNRLVAQRREFLRPSVASAGGDDFDKQITAEWGNENRCQFVAPIFLNPPNCLYLQKVCDFIQNYKIKFKFHYFFCNKCASWPYFNTTIGRILTRQLAVFWRDSWLIFDATVGRILTRQLAILSLGIPFGQ